MTIGNYKIERITDTTYRVSYIIDDSTAIKKLIGIKSLSKILDVVFTDSIDEED